ncbi:MAG TPA: MFS transporter [Patescibacteria group bacterium]|nr:MFS transporter [Patescibacteria group bacterium]
MDATSTVTTLSEDLNIEEPNESKEKLNLILFLGGKLVSSLGTYIYSFAISLYILKVTGSGTSFAFSLLVGTLPRVLLSPIAGSVADRVDRKKMMVGLDFLSGAVVLTLLVLSLTYGLMLPFIYATTFTLSVISTFFITTDNAAIPRLVSDKKLIKINSYSRAIDSGSSILGPVLGGLAFGFVSMNLFLMINGISFILSAISELFIDFNFNKPKEEKKVDSAMSMNAVWKDIKEVFAFIKSNKILLAIIPFSMSFNFLISATFNVTLPYLINNVLGLPASQYGFIEGAFSAGMLTAAIVIAKLPEKEKKLKGLVIGIGGMGLATIIMGIPGLGILNGFHMMLTFGLYIAMAFLLSFFILMIDMPLMVVMQRAIPNEMLGRVWGVMGTLSGGLMPLGIVLAGITLDLIPAYVLFFVTGIYFIIAAVLLYKNKAMQEY